MNCHTCPPGSILSVKWSEVHRKTDLFLIERKTPMTRTRRPQAIARQHLEPSRVHCWLCGQRMWIAIPHESNHHHASWSLSAHSTCSFLLQPDMSALSPLNAGQTLTFAPFSLNLQGISKKQEFCPGRRYKQSV
jgi:hypothetical protein